jgi:hypothetical protein
MPEHIQSIYYSLPKFKPAPPPNFDKSTVKSREIRSVEEGGMYGGQWSKATKDREGFGIIVWKDGSTYEGYWQKDQPEGPGRMVSHSTSTIS